MSRKLLVIILEIVVVLVALFFVLNLFHPSIKELNPKNLKDSSPAYFTYQGKVWYSALLFGSRGEPKIVEDADPASFRQHKLATGEEYGTDKNFVFCAGRKIDGSHGPTFNDNDPNYAYDKNQVYYPYCNIIVGADAQSFQIISPGSYAKDKNHVYHFQSIVPNADPTTFIVPVSSNNDELPHGGLEGVSPRLN